MQLLPLIMAVVPSVVLVFYFIHLDRARPEPRGEVLRAFLLGVLSTLPAIVLELITDAFLRPWFINPVRFALVEAFVVAALCEEGIKLVVVRQFIYRRSHFDEVMDGILYTVAAGLGFACLENILYVASGGMAVALTRAFTAVPLHTICSALLGYAIGVAHFADTAEREEALIARGLFLAVLIHGGYDFLLFVVPYWGSSMALGVIPLLIGSAYMVKRRIRAARLLDRRAGRS